MVIANGTPAPFAFHVTGFLYSTLVNTTVSLLMFVYLAIVYLSTVIVCHCDSANVL